MRESSIEFCPVPSEQQPVNEYEQLKDSWLFHWVTLEKFAYWRKLGWVGLGGSMLVSPIAASSFPPQKSPLMFALSSVLGGWLIVALLLLRLVLGWYYIRDRLQADKVFYEESGWYDGQTWQKTPEILARDRLIVTYQIQPILQRLKGTSLILAILIGSGTLLWLLP